MTTEKQEKQTNGNYIKIPLAATGGAGLGSLGMIILLRILNLGGDTTSKEVNDKRFENIENSLKRIEEKVECVPILKYRLETLEQRIDELKSEHIHYKDLASQPVKEDNKEISKQ